MVNENIYPLRQALVLACDDIENRVNEKMNGENKGIKVNIPVVDSHVNPFQAGDLISVIGVTRNYKSGFMEYVFDSAVQEAMSYSTNKCAIHVSWEVSTEMYAMRLLSRATGIPLKDMVRADVQTKDIGPMRITAGNLSGMPVFIIANSTTRKSNGKRSRDRLERNMVEDAIDHIINGNEFKDVETNQNFDPILMTFDYLQLIPMIGKDMRLWTMECTKWSKDMAFFGGCPVMLAVQAKREVEDRNIKIPEIHDGQETSAIEQYSDAVFSTCIPSATEREIVEGKTINWLSAYPNLALNRNLFILALLKQKNNWANKAWALHVDFTTGSISEIVRKGYEPR